jgi:hypothetical protein
MGGGQQPDSIPFDNVGIADDTEEVLNALTVLCLKIVINMVVKDMLKYD